MEGMKGEGVRNRKNVEHAESKGSKKGAKESEPSFSISHNKTKTSVVTREGAFILVFL